MEISDSGREKSVSLPAAPARVVRRDEGEGVIDRTAQPDSEDVVVSRAHFQASRYRNETELIGAVSGWIAAWLAKRGLLPPEAMAAVIPLASDLLMLAPHLAAVWLAFRGRAFWSGIAAVQLGFMLGGSIVIETVFALHGVGYLGWSLVAKSMVVREADRALGIIEKEASRLSIFNLGLFLGGVAETARSVYESASGALLVLADGAKPSLSRLIAFEPTHIIFDFIDERFDLLSVAGTLVSVSQAGLSCSTTVFSQMTSFPAGNRDLVTPDATMVASVKIGAPAARTSAMRAS